MKFYVLTLYLALGSLAHANEISLRNSSDTCNSSTEGALRYTSASKSFEACDGTNWISFVSDESDITTTAATIHNGFDEAEVNGGPPSAAWDDDINVNAPTSGYGSSAIGAWIGQDFATAKKVRKVRWYRYNVGNTTAISIDYSDDASNWTTATNITGATSTGTWYDINVPDVGAHRYWRVVVDAIRQDGTNYPTHMAELEMYLVQ
jgi:hypothetical protein